jgi:hypothetical protein
MSPILLLPSKKGRISTGENGVASITPTSVYVSGNYTYLTSQRSNTLEVVDITNPDVPFNSGTLKSSTNGAQVRNPFSVYVSGNYAYVASTGGDALDIVDISDPTNPIHKGSLLGGIGGAMLSSPWSVFVSGNYAYVASWFSDALEIVDVTDPSAPVHKGSLTNGSGGALLHRPESVYVSGNYAYVVGGGNALEVVDVTDPANPVHYASLTDGTGGANLNYPVSVFVSGGYAYITCLSSGVLEIVDVNNPAAPVHKGSISNGQDGALLYEPISVYVSGNYAYVVSFFSHSLEIVDVSNPAGPVHKGSITDGTGGALLSYPYSVFVSGNYAFIASSGSNALEIVDVSNPGAPMHAGSITDGTDGALLWDPRSVFVSGNHAYLASQRSSALQVVSLNFPNKQNQFISFNSISDVTVGDLDFSLSASTSSGLEVSYLSSSNKVSLNGSIVTIVSAGRAEVTATQSGNSEYNAATPVSNSFCINPSKPEITVTNIDTPSPTLTSSSPSGNQWYLNGVPLSSETSISLNVVTDGTYTIQTSVDDCFSTLSSPIVIEIFVKLDQAISLNSIPDVTIGDPDFPLAATASSGLEVSYSSSSNKISLNGNIVTILSSGRAEITATQSGNGNYNAATPVSNSFCINPEKPEITVTGIDTPSVTLTSSSPSGNQWFLNGAPLPSETGNTLNVITDGSYTIQTSVDDCRSEFSAEILLIITGDLVGSNSELELFPNPVNHVLHLKLPWSGPKVVSIMQSDGRTTEKLLTENKELAVPVSHYASGLYFVFIRQGQGFVKIRFVKN